MQTFGRAEPLGNILHDITPALEFNCCVNGSKLTACLTQQEENGYQFIYHVSFSNGHKGVYVAVENEDGWWEEKLHHSEYAKAIRDDLNAIVGFDRENHPLCIAVAHNGEDVNVWVRSGRGEEGKYSVYYGGDFRFYLHRTKAGLEASTVERHLGYINQDILHIVKETLKNRKL